MHRTGSAAARRSVVTFCGLWLVGIRQGELDGGLRSESSSQRWRPTLKIEMQFQENESCRDC